MTETEPSGVCRRRSSSMAPAAVIGSSASMATIQNNTDSVVEITDINRSITFEFYVFQTISKLSGINLVSSAKSPKTVVRRAMNVGSSWLGSVLVGHGSIHRDVGRWLG